MKIEIDTKHDSPEEIKKVIKMLQHLVGEQAYTNNPNIFEDPTSFGTGSASQETSSASEGNSSQTNAFVNMFGDTTTASEAKEEHMSNDEKTEEKKDIPEIVPY